MTSKNGLSSSKGSFSACLTEVYLTGILGQGMTGPKVAPNEQTNQRIQPYK